MVVLSSSSPSPISIVGCSGASTVSFNPETSKYTIKFDGKTIETTVTDKATIVDQWVQDINNRQYPPNLSVIFGLGFERFHGWKASTLHLCIDDKCLILQLLHIDNLPLSLKNFIKNPNFFFVGYGVVDDFRYHSSVDWGGLEWGNALVEIKRIANGKRPNEAGLKELAKELLGLSMKKPRLVSLSNWKNRVLTIEQVEYGSIDAYVSCKLGNLLLRDD